MAYLDDIRQVLNIQPVGLPTVVHLSQNENGRRLYFVISGNESAFPSGVTVTISGTKPDGVVYSKSGSITNGVVLINEDTQLTAVAGIWDAKIKIVSSGQTVATGRVRFIIDADPVAPGSVPSDSQLEGLVAEAQWYAENAREEAYGSPLTASIAAGMTDHDHVYVYTGSETGYTAGHWYYWDGSAWEDGGVYNAVAVQTDKTLSVADKAADGKAVGDAINQAVIDLEDQIDEIEPLSEDAKAALLNCFMNVAWANEHGQTYYDALYDALYPETNLVSITAVFDSGQNNIYSNTPLNDLKAYLTVTGHYNDGTSKTVHDYTLSGTLSIGTSTITVFKDGRFTTFDVVVLDGLDSIAYGTLTYRDMFVTNNYIKIGDFEDVTLSTTEQTLSNGDTFKIANSTPFITDQYAKVGSKSLGVTSDKTSPQVNYVSTRQPASARVLSAACIKVDEYISGNVGMQVNVSSADLSAPGIGLCYQNAVTDGFVEVVRINSYTYDPTAYPTAKFNVFIGDYNTGKATAYIDACVVTVVPDGMTLADAQRLYHDYIQMVQN